MIIFTYFDAEIDMHLEGSTPELEVVDSDTGYRVEFRHGHIRVWDKECYLVIDSSGPVGNIV